MHKMTMVSAALILGLAAPRPAHAQLNGNDLRADHGVEAGTVAAPGLYVGVLYTYYNADTLKDHGGDVLATTGQSSVNAMIPMVVWVSRAKILGASVGAMAAVAIQDNALAAPLLGLDAASGFASGDSYMQPFLLGWHAPKADFAAAVGLYAPTGRYTKGATNNTGLGQTALELSGGSTVYLDSGKSISAATMVFWETHTPKKNNDTTVGQMLTLKGGVGKSFKHGAMKVGAAYYAQWTLTPDRFGTTELDDFAAGNKTRVFGAGPDITVPLATSGKLIALINARAEWEFGAQSTTQGFMSMVTATFPVPSVKIK